MVSMLGKAKAVVEIPTSGFGLALMYLDKGRIRFNTNNLFTKPEVLNQFMRGQNRLNLWKGKTGEDPAVDLKDDRLLGFDSYPDPKFLEQVREGLYALVRDYRIEAAAGMMKGWPYLDSAPSRRAVHLKQLEGLAEMHIEAITNVLRTEERASYQPVAATA